ncbi:uncharacterized protein LOC129734205 isoform X3 [Falco cherrug]|uniref:uncharacterized protein LOC129734205 isoform X3 n=1 Tax=Falco cherrug TaxID=345164 RepID=UPI002479E70E|nr:uncharacterized protein LOC129734205 isoform X3 [Falco cherrug]
MGYAYGPGRWVHFRPARRAGVAVGVRSLRREPGRVSGRDVRRRAGFVWNCTLTNQGERNRRASAVACREAVSLVREHAAGKRIVVLRGDFQAELTSGVLWLRGRPAVSWWMCFWKKQQREL